MWRNEWAEVACVREAFEETGLRVSIRKPLAVFDTSHYFLCKLNSPRENLRLKPDECIESLWLKPEDLLRLGTVMDLRRMIPVLQLAGLPTPTLPNGLVPATPTLQF